jgi:hypothetical protein
MNDKLMIVAVILYLIFVGFFLYVCVVADARRSPIARKITVELPEWCYAVCEEWILGTKTTESLATLYNAIFRERNAILQILYLILVLGGWSIMFNYGYAHIPNKYIPGWHRYSGFFVFVICMITFHRACRSNPGFITAKNIDKFDNYPYDNILYKANTICPTAKIRKLARSKYDRMTKRHVARFDHYCAWIDQSVGEENYRIFLLFLFVQVVMCWYGTVILYYIFKNEIDELQLFQVKFINAHTKVEVEANLWVVTQFLCARHGPMVGHLLLMGVMAIVLTAFLLFHLHLIARGMTTNEFYKWRTLHRNRIKTNRSSTNNKLQQSYNDTNPMQPNGGIDAGELNSENEKLSDDDDQSILNIYNLGLIENIKEVIFPRSLRPVGKRQYVNMQSCPNTKDPSLGNSFPSDKEISKIKIS